MSRLVDPVVASLTSVSLTPHGSAKRIVVPKKVPGGKPGGFRLIPIPMHSDRDALLNKIYPRTAHGRLILPRRHILNMGLSAAALALFGIQTSGCKDSCGEALNIGEILIEIFDVIASAFTQGDAIPSQSTLMNDSNVTQKIKIATSLISEVAEGVCQLVKTEDSPILDIPPGKHQLMSDGTGLAPSDSGSHHVDLAAGQSSKSSSTFTVS